MFLMPILAAALLLTGCAAGWGPQVGTQALLFSDYSAPVSVAHSEAGFTKVGTAEYVNVLGLVAVGDASIQAAMKCGGLTRVHHVDYRSFNVLGVYHKMTVYVYGD